MLSERALNTSRIVSSVTVHWLFKENMGVISPLKGLKELEIRMWALFRSGSMKACTCKQGTSKIWEYTGGAQKSGITQSCHTGQDRNERKYLVHGVHSGGDLANGVPWVLAGALNVPHDAFHQVEMDTPIHGNTNIQPGVQLCLQDIGPFNDDDLGSVSPAVSTTPQTVEGEGSTSLMLTDPGCWGLNTLVRVAATFAEVVQRQVRGTALPEILGEWLVDEFEYVRNVCVCVCIQVWGRCAPAPW